MSMTRRGATGLAVMLAKSQDAVNSRCRSLHKMQFNCTNESSTCVSMTLQESPAKTYSAVCSAWRDAAQGCEVGPARSGPPSQQPQLEPLVLELNQHTHIEPLRPWCFS